MDAAQRLASIEAAMDAAERRERFQPYAYTPPTPPQPAVPFDSKAFDEAVRENRRTRYERSSYGFPDTTNATPAEAPPEDDIPY